MENSETLEYVCYGSVIALIVLVGFIWTRLQDRRAKARIDKTWSKLAANTGLDYARHSIHGYFRGFELKMTVHNPGFSGLSVEHTGNCTRIQIYTKNNTRAFFMLKRATGPKVLRSNAIKFGNESFDKEVSFLAKLREFASAILTDAIRSSSYNYCPDATRPT